MSLPWLSAATRRLRLGRSGDRPCAIRWPLTRQRIARPTVAWGASDAATSVAAQWGVPAALEVDVRVSQTIVERRTAAIVGRRRRGERGSAMDTAIGPPRDPLHSKLQEIGQRPRRCDERLGCKVEWKPDRVVWCA